MEITVGIVFAVLVIGATLGVLGAEWLRRREDVRQTEQEVKADTDSMMEREGTRVVRESDRQALDEYEQDRVRWKGRGKK